MIYQIVSGKNISELQLHVARQLEQDWIPCGGPFVQRSSVTRPDLDLLCQALIKYGTADFPTSGKSPS